MDPIGLAGGLNLYGYGSGDPVNNSDPLGLCGPLTPVCARIALGWLTRGAFVTAAAGAAMTDLSSPGPSVGANRLAGLAGEAKAAVQLVEEGWTIIGRHVAANTSIGRRVIDILAKAPGTDGAIVAFEVKVGGAVRNASQLAKDWLMESEGATLVGKNAGYLRDQFLRFETNELRP